MSFLLSGSPGDAIPDSGITQAQRYWPADDGSGSTISEEREGDDSTGFGGAWQSGSYMGGTAPYYDGTTYDTATYDFESSFNGFGFFIAVEADSGSSERYFCEPTQDSDDWKPGPSGRLDGNDDLVLFTDDGGSTLSLTSSNFPTGEIATIGASYIPNDEVVLYVNGSRVDSVTVGTPQNDTPTTMNWGASRFDDRRWEGVLDARLHLMGDYWSDSDHQTLHDNYMDAI